MNCHGSLFQHFLNIYFFYIIVSNHFTTNWYYTVFVLRYFLQFIPYSSCNCFLRCFLHRYFWFNYFRFSCILTSDILFTFFDTISKFLSCSVLIVMNCHGSLFQHFLNIYFFYIIVSNHFTTNWYYTVFILRCFLQFVSYSSRYCFLRCFLYSNLRLDCFHFSYILTSDVFFTLFYRLSKFLSCSVLIVMNCHGSLFQHFLNIYFFYIIVSNHFTTNWYYTVFVLRYFLQFVSSCSRYNLFR